MNSTSAPSSLSLNSGALSLNSGGLLNSGGVLNSGGLSLNSGSLFTSTQSNVQSVALKGLSPENSLTTLSSSSQLHSTGLSQSRSLTSAPNQRTLPEMQVQRFGSQHLADMKENGMFSVKEDKDRRTQVDALIKTTALQITHARGEIDKALESFRKQTKQFNDKSATYGMSLIDKILQGSSISESDATHANFAFNLAKQVENRYKETVTTLMDLEKLNQEGKLGVYSQLINTVFDVRFRELDLLTKRLEMMRAQDNHDVALSVNISNQVLKEQAQEFDLWLKSVEFESQDKQRVFDNHLKEREQTFQQEENLIELSLKQQKFASEEEREKKRLEYETKLKEAKMKYDQETSIKTLEQGNQKLQNEKEVALKTLDSQKEIETKRIDSAADVEKKRLLANTTVELTKTVSQVVKPTCSIQ